MKKNINKNSGFTLIELLVVISIIGMLSSIVLASVSSARDKATNVATKAEVIQIQTAMELYYQAYGSYPNPVTPAAIRYYCIGASSCPSVNPVTFGIGVNTTYQLPTYTGVSTYLSQFTTLKTPITYFCSVASTACPYGSAWLVYPQKSGNTTTYYAVKVGDSGISATY